MGVASTSRRSSACIHLNSSGAFAAAKALPCLRTPCLISVFASPGGEQDLLPLLHNGAAPQMPGSAERETEGSAPANQVKSRAGSQTGTTTATDSGSGTPLNDTAGDFKSDFLTSLTVRPGCRQDGSCVPRAVTTVPTCLLHRQSCEVVIQKAITISTVQRVVLRSYAVDLAFQRESHQLLCIIP